MDDTFKNEATEIFSIWEYHSYVDYEAIEDNVKNNDEHVQGGQEW